MGTKIGPDPCHPFAMPPYMISMPTRLSAVPPGAPRASQSRDLIALLSGCCRILTPISCQFHHSRIETLI